MLFMIEFMVIGYPRSATTWTANWLTTDTTQCLHDPLYQYHYSDLDNIKSSKVIGLSCTGLWNFHNWVNLHPARKVILHRDFKEVNNSLNEIGLPSLSKNSYQKLDQIVGIHIDYEDIFNNPKNIYEYLLQKSFDEERHKLLKDMFIQPVFDEIKVNHHATKKLLEELRGI